jgi:hypothetical protein
MTRITTGNATDAFKTQQRNGWFVGHFIDSCALCRTRDVEVKWALHPAGDAKASSGVNKTAKTMSVLIRGRFRLMFDEGDTVQEVLLEREGDYALWDAGVAHSWVTEEDSVILTVRWPSVPEDQIQAVRDDAVHN